MLTVTILSQTTMIKKLSVFVYREMIHAGIILDFSQDRSKLVTFSNFQSTTTAIPTSSSTHGELSADNKPENWMSVFHLIFEIPLDIVVAISAVVTLSICARKLYLHLKKKICKRGTDISMSALPISVANDIENQPVFRRFCQENGCHGA